MPEHGGGERPGSRECIDRVTKHLVEHGMKPDRAKERARKSRLRNERREQGER